ncbi:hypothetical protein GDO86_006022 [Hymenochirus boettgeri]|uniref:MICOS complex subunit MIC19 n=1 Tax=Hymenochirus boettgeri TaxID=247094 RepID=A0A8T2J4C4_9PIPI|nr:hypothetical protein GDO86_006022 [Hymenochirus boettgeri]
MGGSGSTRRVSFEADENDNITVVKGIRLSDNVINRMREPPASAPKPPPHPPQSKPSEPISPSFTVDEEELRKKIAHELALEHARREAENQKRLEHGKLLMQEEIGKALERERNASTEQLTRAVLREKAATEEERLKAKSFSAQFYKVTTEQYQIAASEVEARFKRYEAHPVCADLQTKILQCYQQNQQQSLSCSSLASQYLHCVKGARQGLLGRGG